MFDLMQYALIFYDFQLILARMEGDVQVLAEVTGSAITQLLRAERVDAVIMTAG
jgi:hypothetical protein